MAKRRGGTAFSEEDEESMMKQAMMDEEVNNPNSQRLGKHIEPIRKRYPKDSCGVNVGSKEAVGQQLLLNDSQINVAIYWGTAGVANCVQLENAAFWPEVCR
ncbi:unnamed protein product [Bubo scandiacus]